jgi:hypothetical protein
MPVYDPTQYATIRQGDPVTQNLTEAYVIIPISDEIDLNYIWNHAGGVFDTTNVKYSIVKPDNTVIVRVDTGSMVLVNTAPQLVKVLILTSLGDTSQVGNLQIYPEFKFDLSWLQADRVVVAVSDDATPG